jgi:hypothetical protein
MGLVRSSSGRGSGCATSCVEWGVARVWLSFAAAVAHCWSCFVVVLLPLSASLVGAAPAAAATPSDWCHVARLNPYDPPVATPGPLPVSNLSQVNYAYPDELKRRDLSGRSLVRLKVSSSGQFEAADLLGLEGGSPVEAAMCDLLRRLQWTVITGESQTFVFALRFCLGTCSRQVPMFPGFETHEIVINGNL